MAGEEYYTFLRWLPATGSITLMAMVAVSAETLSAGPPEPALNRQRYLAHEARVQRRAAERDALLAARKKLAPGPDRHTP